MSIEKKHRVLADLHPGQLVVVRDMHGRIDVSSWGGDDRLYKSIPVGTVALYLSDRTIDGSTGYKHIFRNLLVGEQVVFVSEIFVFPMQESKRP